MTKGWRRVCKQLKIPLTSKCGIQNDQGAHSMPRKGCATHGASHQHGTVENVIRQTRSRYTPLLQCPSMVIGGKCMPNCPMTLG
ncbi:hypothetical protein JTE90_019993 [Oedothorax gibbosus]|uniref:Uncharacterized protein n=1 Tax=Oedothorax gibbosus TaxID=931172 RepID=A0AAV6U0K2_9ARAC|nr:hypothetical protein JTE90_019993 [Oedothorax gibbosus]